jgi:hypothetical protein
VAGQTLIPVLILSVATVIGLVLVSPLACVVLLTDGAPAAAVIISGLGWGAWPSVWLVRDRGARGARFFVALALGTGILGTAALALGAAGALNRVVALGLLGAGAALGAAWLYVRQADRRHVHEHTPEPHSRFGLGWQGIALLPLAVPLVIMLVGATLPPGMLWVDEAFGYDALEYHLQCPREYYEAGRITFLPHNVYASFPQQMEMLYLLLMHAAGGPYAAAIACQVLHALFGVLAVAALCGATAAGWARVAVALAAGGVTWVAYVGALAYVENGVLLYAATAALLLRNAVSRETALRGAVAGGSNNGVSRETELREPAGWQVDNCVSRETHYRGAPDSLRLLLAGGLCAGLAGGCKYTALALVAGGLALAGLAVWIGGGRRAADSSPKGESPGWLRGLAAFVLGAAVAFSPWPVRNAAFAGNPVFPFAYEWFGGRDWSAAQAAQWRSGHALKAADEKLAGRMKTAWDEFFASPLFGPALTALAVVGLMLGRGRFAWMMFAWAAIMLSVWAAATHMPGRFMIPAMVPLALLAGEAWSARRSSVSSAVRGVRALLIGGAAASAALGGARLVDRYVQHERDWLARTNVPMRLMVGRTDVKVETNWVNEKTPPDAFVWQVGDAAVFYVDRRMHYTVVFNRDAWLAAATGADAAACVEWLRARGVTHVVFNWSEVGRLRATYGFDPRVTAEWVAGLMRAGLRRVDDVRAADGRVVAEMFAVEQGLRN